MNVQRYELEKLNNSKETFALVLHLDQQLSEFSSEIGTKTNNKESFSKAALKIIETRYSSIKITVVKVMVGGMLVTTLPLMLNSESTYAQTPSSSQNTEDSAIYYHVGQGDSLWTISRLFNTTVDHIIRANNLRSKTLQLNQRLVIPRAFHSVKSGDSLSVLARDYSTTTIAIRQANNLTSDNIRVGQILIIPVLINKPRTTQTIQPIQPEATTNTYTVVAGDSLSVIASRFNTTTESIRSANNLTSDVIRVGQTLMIPTSGTSGGTTSSPQIQTIDSVYTVVSGDSLSAIAQRFGTTVDALRTVNNLRTDVLQIGQKLVIPNGNTLNNPAPTPVPSPASTVSTYTVVAGDSLSVIAKRFGTTVDSLRTANNLRTDVLQIGQTLTIPSGQSLTSQPQTPAVSTHTVVSGDNLWRLASHYGTTVDSIRTANNLRTDVLQIGQQLTIPNGLNAPTQSNSPSIGSSDPVTITSIQHTIRSGDNMWNLSIQYGVPYIDLLRHNNMTERSTLRVGQIIQIPQYHVPVRPVVSQRHGEVLDWWTEARYVFSTGKTATITDFQTGRSFQVRHTMGGNHADSEPLTARDAQIMREIWGGSYSWTPRAIIVTVDGRNLAAAMHSMPHGDQVIRDNNYNGHFCIHFVNSTRHSDGKVQETMHRQIEIAAGRSISR